MELLKNHIVQIIQFLWPHFSQHLDYAINTDAHLVALTSATEKLKGKRKDIQGDDGEGPSWKRRKLTHQAQQWIAKICDLEKEVDSIKSEFEQRRMPVNGYFPNLFSRYKLGRRAAELLGDVNDLNDERPLKDVVANHRRGWVVEMQESLPSEQNTSKETIEEIWQCLQEDGNQIICVYGMGGVGKTTLVKTINNRLFGTQDFDVVMWITVSKEFNLETIQKEVGIILGLNFNCGEPKKDAIFAALNGMKYLLILDDLWQVFDLEEAGIPKPNRQTKCKIVITTRFIQVGDVMESNKFIRVRTLSKQEAWNLFCDKAGYVANLPGIESLAKEVAEECGGLPLAIITAGLAMQRKDKKQLWLDALRALRGSAPEIPGMEPKVFLSLKLSYDHLEDDMVKHCFLYCALFPKDFNIRIRKLVRYWTMEGFIDNVESLEDAWTKGHAIVRRIKEACLLTEGQPEDRYVKMHDIIRDLAIWITSSSSHEEPKFLVRAHMELKIPPREEMWEDMERISLMWNEIEELPSQPNCPKLVSLLLRKNPQLKIIPISFFEFMPKLRVLDLSYTAIRCLPMSLASLVNLRAVILKCCSKLVELPSFRHLKQLQFVDFSCSAISKLPEGFENLVKLKQLCLSNMGCLRRIPENVLSKLSNLEELRLLKTYVNWATEGQPQDMNGATLGEVAMLKCLTTFNITILDIDCLEHDVFHPLWSGLRSFAFHIGPSWDDGLNCNNSVQIHECDHFPPGIRAVVKYAEGLSFMNCRGLTRVSQLAGHSKRLRQIRVYNFHGMDCVIDWRDVEEGALQWLECLFLDGLTNLETLFAGAILPESLRNLRSIEVSNCEKLKCLFSSNMIEHLDRLEELVVQSCDEMEEIVSGEMLADNAVPNLYRLQLDGLRKLTRIISSTRLAFSNLQEMRVFRCPTLKKLPLCPNIQKIRGEREWWHALEWEDESTRFLFHQKYNQ